MMGDAYKVYNQKNVIDNDLSTGYAYVTAEKYNSLKAFRIFPGDVLLTTRGTIGRAAIFPDDAEEGVLHPCLMRIQLNVTIMKEFLVKLLEDTDILTEQLSVLSNATTIEVIYSDSLKQINVPLPPINEQKVILEYLDREAAQMDGIAQAIRAQIGTVREYRKALISAAVTGRIDVRGEAGNPA